MAILRVTQAFAKLTGEIYTPGMLVHSSDPITKKLPGNFEPVEAAATRATETAVAAPGLRRTRTQPAKKATSRRAAKGEGKTPEAPAATEPVIVPEAGPELTEPPAGTSVVTPATETPEA